jgi:hypothetical protein
MERWIGCAAEGAVCVAGGAEKVLEPRLPMLLPEPGLAMARVGASARETATAIAAILVERRVDMGVTSQGKAGKPPARSI